MLPIAPEHEVHEIRTLLRKRDENTFALPNKIAFCEVVYHTSPIGKEGDPMPLAIHAKFTYSAHEKDCPSIQTSASVPHEDDRTWRHSFLHTKTAASH